MTAPGHQIDFAALAQSLLVDLRSVAGMEQREHIAAKLRELHAQWTDEAARAERESCRQIAHEQYDKAEENMAKWDQIAWPNPGYITSEQRQRDSARASTAYAIESMIRARGGAAK